MNSYVQIEWLNDENVSSEILLITAGFSDAAYKHCLEMASLVRGYRIGICKYASFVQELQKKACNGSNKALDEEEIYQKCTDALADEFKQYAIENVTFVAKSAGGAVALLLSKQIEFKKFILQAPALPMCNLSMKSPKEGVSLHWCKDDQKIPLDNLHKTFTYLSVCGVEVPNSRCFIHEIGGHDFVPEIFTQLNDVGEMK